MAKKKTNEVIGTVKLVCHVEKWTGFKPGCDRILSIQNCHNFFGPGQACDCFEMKELDIKDRELQRIEEMITETEDPNNTPKDDIEIRILDSDEPPLENKPKKKRKRRKKIQIEEEA